MSTTDESLPENPTVVNPTLITPPPPPETPNETDPLKMSTTDESLPKKMIVANPTFFRGLQLITPIPPHKIPMETNPQKLPMKDKTFYDLLYLPQTATPDEIKQSYYRLAVICHPDKNPDNPEARDRFMRVSQAYSVLMDPTKRQIYDKYGLRGLYVSSKVGEEYVGIYFTISAPWRNTVAVCGSVYSKVAKCPKFLKKSVSSSVGFFKRLWSADDGEEPRVV